jgi:hypothetical protein
MAKNTKTTTTYTPADVREMWPAARAKWIIALMSDKDEPLSYADAVTWSRRYMKREQTYYVG